MNSRAHAGTRPGGGRMRVGTDQQWPTVEGELSGTYQLRQTEPERERVYGEEIGPKPPAHEPAAERIAYNALLSQASDALKGQGSQDSWLIKEALTPGHLKKAKLMFFFSRYPTSSLLKSYFLDIQFTRCITSQLIKWFSNFREFYYIQMEKFARQALLEGITELSDLIVTRDSELFRILNVHYNKGNDFKVPDGFLDVANLTLQEFFTAVRAGRDLDPSWKKPIYKIISKLDRSPRGIENSKDTKTPRLRLKFPRIQMHKACSAKLFCEELQQHLRQRLRRKPGERGTAQATPSTRQRAEKEEELRGPYADKAPAPGIMGKRKRVARRVASVVCAPHDLLSRYSQEVTACKKRGREDTGDVLWATMTWSKYALLGAGTRARLCSTHFMSQWHTLFSRTLFPTPVNIHSCADQVLGGSAISSAEASSRLRCSHNALWECLFACTGKPSPALRLALLVLLKSELDAGGGGEGGRPLTGSPNRRYAATEGMEEACCLSVACSSALTRLLNRTKFFASATPRPSMAHTVQPDSFPHACKHSLLRGSGSRRLRHIVSGGELPFALFPQCSVGMLICMYREAFSSSAIGSACPSEERVGCGRRGRGRKTADGLSEPPLCSHRGNGRGMLSIGRLQLGAYPSAESD
ncbi:prospero homeobox protein 2-like [Crotalus adamanteus]|uniref:Prospero homeobox protein 2-like n=1 Tax=Crotalus adamanteus TaxID=8729 RepID=A0AAW1C5B2_CROAD